MKDELRIKIEEFLIDYENNLDDIHNTIPNMEYFLNKAISLLTEVVNGV